MPGGAGHPTERDLGAAGVNRIGRRWIVGRRRIVPAIVVAAAAAQRERRQKDRAVPCRMFIESFPVCWSASYCTVIVPDMPATVPGVGWLPWTVQ